MSSVKLFYGACMSEAVAAVKCALLCVALLCGLMTKLTSLLQMIEALSGKNATAIVSGAMTSAVLIPRAWVHDSEAKECMGCKSSFSFTNRKHHCRHCGGIFCGKCSSHKVAILKLETTELMRVCDKCYTTLRT